MRWARYSLADPFDGENRPGLLYVHGRDIENEILRPELPAVIRQQQPGGTSYPNAGGCLGPQAVIGPCAWGKPHRGTVLDMASLTETLEVVRVPAGGHPQKVKILLGRDDRDGVVDRGGHDIRPPLFSQ